MDYEKLFAEYIEKVISARTSEEGVIGVLKELDLQQRCAIFLPHLVFEANDTRAYIERNVPVKLGFELFSSGKYSIRPLSQNYLEERVRIINERADKSRNGGIGFHRDKEA